MNHINQRQPGQQQRQSDSSDAANLMTGEPHKFEAAFKEAELRWCEATRVNRWKRQLPTQTTSSPDGSRGGDGCKKGEKSAGNGLILPSKSTSCRSFCCTSCAFPSSGRWDSPVESSRANKRHNLQSSCFTISSQLLVASIFISVCLLSHRLLVESKSIDESQPASVSFHHQGDTKASAEHLENLVASNATSASPNTLSDLLLKFEPAFVPIEPPPKEIATGTTTATTEASTSNTAEPTTTTGEDENLEDGSSSGDADNDAEDCKGLSINEPAEGKNYTDHERLVNLQSCFQGKVKRRLMSTTRSGLELFDRMSLSGGCTASLMNLMTSLGELKSFAFKFLDASAKIPSGVMYGLLSDFGDFDQCLSIRANPSISVEDEVEEGSYSGKYCLLSLKLNYHIQLDENKTVPEGIIPDGVIWDELVRNYWTSESPKGFQVGMCFPSRCTNDDLDQIFRQVTSGYNIGGEVMSCQDGRDIARQYAPDCLQKLITYTFQVILLFTISGTLLDRYDGLKFLLPCAYKYQSRGTGKDCHRSSENGAQVIGATCLVQNLVLIVETLLCFSIIRNWKKFMQTDSNTQLASWDTSFNELDHQSHLADDKIVATAHRSDSLTSSQAAETNTEDLVYTREITSSDATSATNSIDNSLLVAKLNQLNVEVDVAASTTYRRQTQATFKFVQTPPQATSIDDSLKHLAGLKLFIILWITIGHSFLYPSANNYQYYRSIINMNITRDSVWFATTNFTLGIDMLLYITGLVFVSKLANSSSMAYKQGDRWSLRLDLRGGEISRLMLRKILRFWPTYLSVIGLAIVIPLVSDGPMWPEMVTKRLGESCRKHWWANLLIVNNLLNQSEVCLPSSWFVSVLMQLFLIGSLVTLLSGRFSLKVVVAALFLLLAVSIGSTFAFVYLVNVRAPVIKMDESFVMDLDEKIFGLYTNIFNNLGPFVIGMLGGIILLAAKVQQKHETTTRRGQRSTSTPTPNKNERDSDQFLWGSLVNHSLVAILVSFVAILVLSSVFHEQYTRFWAAIYWSTHRIGWAIVTGYIIHQCAMGYWKLLNDFMSLSTFVPLSKLIFIAYLVYPIYIHIHSGLVRDGLHVSIYNMLNIYITRLVMTFATAALIHLLIELPFRSIEEVYLKNWFLWMNKSRPNKNKARTSPLLASAPVITNLRDSKLAEKGNSHVKNTIVDDKESCNLGQ